MDDARPWSPVSDGADEKASSSSFCWGIAEEATQDIIMMVQATAVSEERRKAVISYVQRLVRNSTCCEVFPFGSVPLKTYLPDGDIDLTAVNSMNVDEEVLAKDVYNVLEREDRNHAAEFVVKDVQLIRAEVKLVKCLVQNIVVDISFNQLGGLSTLCFLEKVSCLIGKNHLFKRSIILIKAWCYYESRVLGAHHGLISTYALETLVLYIFNLFHSSLNGPLAVLYKFLEHFSRFDWDKYCISLNGPVLIASLPEVVIERSESLECDMLLSSDFIKECVEEFSVPNRGFEANSRIFSLKHLNIVDPLKDNNNLGRSVSKGNFFRIKSAFTYGARKLGRILSLPKESAADEVRNFFSNTLDRHERRQRPDVQGPVLFDRSFGLDSTLPASSRDSDSIQDHLRDALKSGNDDFRNPECNGFSEKDIGKKGSFNQLEIEELSISENNDATKLSTTGVQSLSISTDALNYFEQTNSPVMQVYYSPQPLYLNPFLETGEIANGSLEMKQLNGLSYPKKYTLGVLGVSFDEAACLERDFDEKLSKVEESRSPFIFSNQYSLSSEKAECFCHLNSNHPSENNADDSEEFSSLPDLHGDYGSHLSNLHTSRHLYECSPKPASPGFLSQVQSKMSWDIAIPSPSEYKRPSGSLRDNVFSRPVLYLNSPLLVGSAFGIEEMAKHRGTGTYFPNVNHYKERGLNSRGRQQTSARSPRSNARTVSTQDTSAFERKHATSDLRPSKLLESKSQNPGVSVLSPRVKEFGSIRHPIFGSLSEENGRDTYPGPVPIHHPVSDNVNGKSRANLASPPEHDRLDAQVYELKDEEDFPPLADSNGKGLTMCHVKSDKC